MLKDKVVIITGGTRGIGLETARTFIKNKAKVIIFGSRKESVDKALDELKNEGLAADGYYPNLGSYEDINDTMKLIVSKYKKIDVLVNNAGLSESKPIEDLSTDDFDRVVNLNLNSLFYTIKAVVPYMKDNNGGVILNTSSMVSIYGQPSGVSYPASKFAVNGLTKSLARELGKYNIRVNAVAPGVTNTDMVKKLPQDKVEMLVKTIPLGRIGEPTDIANAFLFLASDLATYVTGTILSVDGAARN